MFKFKKTITFTDFDRVISGYQHKKLNKFIVTKIVTPDEVNTIVIKVNDYIYFSDTNAGLKPANNDSKIGKIEELFIPTNKDLLQWHVKIKGQAKPKRLYFFNSSINWFLLKFFHKPE